MLCMLIAASLAVNVRFNGPSNRPAAYLAITFVLPLLWGVTVRLCGAYDPKLIGVGSDEFRRVLNAGVCMTAAVAIASYVTRFDLARTYVAIALPTATVLNLFARYWLRKRLHARRTAGYAMQRVVAVGHPDSVASLISELGRWHSHGLSVVGACLTGDTTFFPTISGVPVVGGVDETTRAVATLEADTVAVLACPELSGARMRELAWELEESGTDVYIAPRVARHRRGQDHYPAYCRAPVAAYGAPGADRQQACHQVPARQDGRRHRADPAGADLRGDRDPHPRRGRRPRLLQANPGRP